MRTDARENPLSRDEEIKKLRSPQPASFVFLYIPCILMYDELYNPRPKTRNTKTTKTLTVFGKKLRGEVSFGKLFVSRQSLF
jgi:hypothetical protein